jgi:hypothetical protein
MQYQISGKTLDIFWMMRMIADSGGPVAKEDQLHLVFEFEREDAEGEIPNCGFEKVEEWTMFVSTISSL